MLPLMVDSVLGSVLYACDTYRVQVENLKSSCVPAGLSLNTSQGFKP